MAKLYASKASKVRCCFRIFLLADRNLPCHVCLDFFKMKCEQHQFDKVTKYLHHRSPYFLVDRVVSVLSEEAVTQKTAMGEEGFIQGHFPSAPVFPGTMIHELTT